MNCNILECSNSQARGLMIRSKFEVDTDGEPYFISWTFGYVPGSHKECGTHVAKVGGGSGVGVTSQYQNIILKAGQRLA